MKIEKSSGYQERGGVPKDGEATATVARGQNAVFVLPSDPSAIAEFLEPALDRVTADVDATQLVVFTPDAESAIAIARAVRDLDAGRSIRTIAATGVPRVVRLLSLNKAHVIAGAPSAVLELIRASALKLENLRSVVIAWADTIIDVGDAAALEAVMAEIPKDAPRTVVASRMTPAVEMLVERYARRAGRVGGDPAGDAGARSMSFVTVSEASRPGALRRLLDHLNPEIASIYTRSEPARMEVETLLRALGYGTTNSSISVAHRAPAKPGASVVLYELPASRSELQAIIGAGQPAVFALIRPSQAASLSSLAGKGAVTPLSLPGPAERAMQSEDALRTELRVVLKDGVPAREVLLVDPLLDEFDGVEIAAAALKLLQRSRERAPLLSSSAPMPASEASPRMVRVFVSAGKEDGLSPGDLVGAITAESGISSVKIGKIELRDRHSLVEVAGDVAGSVVQSVTGITIRGRRVIAKLDAGGAREESRTARDGGRDSRPRNRAGAPRDGTSRPRGRDDRPDRARSADRPTRFGRSEGSPGRSRSDRKPESGRRPR